MAAFLWRKRATRHFGEVWRPTSVLDLFSAGNRWVSFRCEVDSGAVVSLLRRGAADVLGLTWEDGRLVTLTSVGGQTTEARVFELTARVGERELSPFPVAIAQHENVPHLLGWQGFFDHVGVHFDPAWGETWLSALDSHPIERYVLEWKMFVATLERIAPGVGRIPLRSVVDQAVFSLFQNSEEQFQRIEKAVRVDLLSSACMHVRALFETACGLEYMLNDPTTRHGLAQRYLDYDAFNRYHLLGKLTSVMEHVTAADLAALKGKHDNVKHEFEGKGASKTHWYPCRTFRELVQSTKRDDEYDFVFAACSQTTHGVLDVATNVSYLAKNTFTCFARVALAATDHLGLDLAPEDRDLLSLYAARIMK